MVSIPEAMPLGRLHVALVLGTALGAAAHAGGPPPRDPVAAGAVPREALLTRGRTLVDLTRAGSPAALTLSPRLAALAARDPTRRYLRLELGPWDGERALRLRVRAVPFLVLYQDGRPVARGTRALKAFRETSAARPPPRLLASAGAGELRGG